MSKKEKDCLNCPYFGLFYQSCWLNLSLKCKYKEVNHE